MRIAEIKIVGFKSFVDGVNLPIEAGLTGIVGPNGCGKSNVLESIRWVMGATSAKALRGSEMDDVIFAGTDTRPARDLAEVIIRLDNQDAIAPEPYRNVPFIEISRKIRRGIGSTFRINGKEVRAKDVQLLFADASSGANSPAFVRQGQVSELINARPENRRRVLEEAAGIAGLQARRHEAQIKLGATESNLERVGEHLILMEDQITSLKKQSVRARKYRELQSQIRGLELFLASGRLETMRASLLKTQEDARNGQNMAADALTKLGQSQKKLDELQAGLKPYLEEQAIADALLRRFEARRIEFERDILEIHSKIESLNSQSIRIERDLERENELYCDAETAVAKFESEIKELEAGQDANEDFGDLERKSQSTKSDIAEKEAELSQYLNQKAELSAKIREFERSKVQIETKLANLNRDILARTNQFDSLKAEIEDDKNLGNAETQLHAAQTAYENHNASIEELARELAECEIAHEEKRKTKEDLERNLNSLVSELNGVEAILKSAKIDESESLLGQIRVQKGYERALSAALGDDLNAIIGTKGDKYWKSVANPKFDWPDEFKTFPKLSEFVEAPAELMARINSIIVTESEIPNLPKGARAVTVNGKTYRWDGFVTNNSAAQNAIVLEQRNRKIEIEPLITEKKAELEVLSGDFAKIRTQLSSLRDREKNQRNKTREFMIALDSAQKAVSSAQMALSNKKARLSELEISIAHLNEDAIKAKAEIPKERGLDSGAIEKLEQESNNISQVIAKLREEFSHFQFQIMSIRTENERKEKRILSAKSDLKDWILRRDSAHTRKEQLARELQECQTQAKTIKARPQELEAQKIEALSELPKIEDRKKKADDAIATNNSQIKLSEDAIKSLELQLSAAREAISAAQIITNSWEERIQELETQIFNEHQTPISELTNKIRSELGDLLNGMTNEKATARLQKAFSDRDEIGGVNLRADEELIEVSEKFQRLSKERDDLLTAIAKLKRAIDEINDEGKEKLLRAFDTVNQHFSELFTALFGGGNAHLALSETDDPLGGGLEVYACPPGKRLTSMSLMSGGEQALTATALIFAVFLSNPAPLSVLDELDAPLDDANVDRFCALMDEMRKRTDTRFIVITHHPITMARMDRLFGVTMAERGVSNVVAVDLSRAQSMIEAA